MRTTQHGAGSGGNRLIPHVAPDSVVRVGSMWALPQVLASLGANPAALFAEAGVDIGVFSSQENRLTYGARGHLLRHCASRTGCRHLGLLVGQQGGLQTLGLLGLLMRYSPDVGTALRSLVRFIHLNVRGAGAGLLVDGGWVTLSYEIYYPDTEGTEQVGDGAVAILFNIIRELCGERAKPVEVMFAHRAPDDLAPYRRAFGVPLRFDSECYGVLFSADWLNHRVPDADSEVRRLVQKEIDQLEARFGADLPSQVRALLRTSMLTGNAEATYIASLLSMHCRTLNRRLESYGTHFQQLVEETRFDLARQYLADTAMTVTQVAAALAYAQPSAFTRAFRRWSGTTPARWREMRRRQERDPLSASIAPAVA